MVFVGIAAALMLQASGEGGAKANPTANANAAANASARLAELNSAKDAYQNCIMAQAAGMYQGRNNDELAQAVLASCRDKFDAWMALGMTGAGPEAKAQVMAVTQPMLLAAARLAITAQAARARAGGAANEQSGPVVRHAPQPGRTTASDRHPAEPAAPPAPAGPCGGISVPSDPSALICHN